MHPLHAALIAAADGRFPAVDGGVDIFPPDQRGTGACVEFTGHAVILTRCDAASVISRGATGYGGATHPDLLRWLAGPTGRIGSHDAVLVACGVGGGTEMVGGGTGMVGGGVSTVGGGFSTMGGGAVAERADLEDHPRVLRARHHRRDVVVYANDHGLITMGTGLVGRREVSVELFDAGRAPSGSGGDLIGQALGLVPAGELLWAQVTPGNAGSLRAFLRRGFVPIGAEVLIEPAAH